MSCIPYQMGIFFFWVWEKYLLYSYHDFSKTGILSLGGWNILSCSPGVQETYQIPFNGNLAKVEWAQIKLIIRAKLSLLLALLWEQWDASEGTEWWMRDQVPLLGNSMAKQRSRNVLPLWTIWKKKIKRGLTKPGGVNRDLKVRIPKPNF